MTFWRIKTNYTIFSDFQYTITLTAIKKPKMAQCLGMLPDKNCKSILRKEYDIEIL
jgi:hypothetical protein